MAGRSKGRLTKVNDHHLNILDMRMKEHKNSIERFYNRIRSSKNSARQYLKEKKGVNVLSAEDEEKIEDKYENQYLNHLITENQRFSRWLNDYQHNNINKSKNTLEELIKEVQAPAPKRQRLERKSSIGSLTLSDFGEVLIDKPSSSSSSSTNNAPGTFIEIPVSAPKTADPKPIDMAWFKKLDEDFEGYDKQLIREMEQNALKYTFKLFSN